MTHIPFDPSLYTGRAEPFEPLAQYWYQHIGAFKEQKIALIGFACHQGVNRNLGRIGAKDAPNAIKSAFGKLPIDVDWVKNGDLSTLVGDMGQLICDDDDQIKQGVLEEIQEQYAKQVASVVAQNRLPIGIGGGHEIAWGSFLGLYQGLDNKAKIGIINLDAHFDLRLDKYATSGTPFRQISEFLAQKGEPFYYMAVGISRFSNTAALFDRADKLGVGVIGDDDCQRLPFDEICQRLNAFIAQVDVLYLTLDLDCLLGSVMPAVSAPAAKGLSVDFVERCLSVIIGTGKVKVMDIAEFNPRYDQDGRGLKVVARLLAVMVEASL